MSAPTPGTHSDVTTREAWLEKAIAVYFRPMFAQLGYHLPETVHVSVGWGYGRQGAETKAILGNCWSGMVSDDSNPHVFVSPVLADPVAVLEVFAHELVHATLDPIMDHGKDFKTLANAIGLEGPMTSANADAAAQAEYTLLTQPDGELGPYPHAALTVPEWKTAPVETPVPVGGGSRPRAQRPSAGPAPQAARWVRVVCNDHPTAPVVRTSRKAVANGQGPLCGEPVDEHGTPCGLRMHLQG